MKTFLACALVIASVGSASAQYLGSGSLSGTGSNPNSHYVSRAALSRAALSIWRPSCGGVRQVLAKALAAVRHYKLAQAALRSPHSRFPARR